MMMRRRLGPDSPVRHQRGASDFGINSENGHQHNIHNHNGSLFFGVGGGENGKSPWRRISKTLRSRLRQVIGEGCRRPFKATLAYLGACAFLIWVGLRSGLILEKCGRKVVWHEAGAARELADAPSYSSAGNAVARGGDDVGPRLAYGIMVYQRMGHTHERTLDQFVRMFNALYDKDNTYVIHVDIKSDKELRKAISREVARLDNVHEVPSVSVSWAGITVVERTLALMQKAVEVDDSWRFFVNLGHEDYPSTSQVEMRRWLKDQPDGTNFIKCWPIEGHDFFGQMEKHVSRVRDVHVDDFMGVVKEYRSVTGKRGSQDRAPSDYKFFKSLQQTMLSRQLCEYAVYSSEARRLLLYMATSKAPDELYFPTLTQLDQRYAEMATCDDTRHFSYWIRPGGSWHPEYLTLDHLPLVLNATEFFIRKVEDAQGSRPLLDVLDLLRRGEDIDAALPILKAWLNRPGEDGQPLSIPGGPIMMFTDGSVEDALAELYRRQSEAAEARRAMFLLMIDGRRKKMQLPGMGIGTGTRKRSPEEEAAEGKSPKQPFVDRKRVGAAPPYPASGAATGRPSASDATAVKGVP